MKNLFLLFAVITIFSLSASGQTDKDAPANVKAAFAKKFPAATKIKWGKENEKEWEAEFKMDGFKVDGFWWALAFSIILSLVTGILESFNKKEPKR